MCTRCAKRGSAEPSPTICMAAHQVRVQMLLDEIERLQRELRTVRTQYSFCKLALDCQLRKTTAKKSA